MTTWLMTPRVSPKDGTKYLEGGGLGERTERPAMQHKSSESCPEVDARTLERDVSLML